jgi:hypothetical protein
MTDTILPQTSAPVSGARPPRRSLSRSALIAIVVVVLLIVGAGGFELMKSHSTNPPPVAKPVGANKPATAPSLAALLSLVMGNAQEQRFVHADVTLRSPKHPTLVYSDDDGVTGGVQHVTIAGGGSALVLVIGSTTFVTANRVGLTKFFGLKPHQVTRVLGHWIRLVPGNPEYTSVTEGITLASTLKEIALTGKLTRLPERTLHGQRVFGIQGAVSGSGLEGGHATMWVTVGQHGLPVEFDAAGATTTESVTFSRWGRPVIAHAPAAGSLGSGTLSG